MNRRRKTITVEPRPIERTLSSEEVEGWVKGWIEALPADRTGIHNNSYLWHVFSYDRYPSVCKAEAHQAYKHQVALEFVLIANDQDQGIITKVRPTGCSLEDWLVFPSNFAWTAAFTHMDGWLGPFFARGSTFAELDLQNRQALAKQAQVAEAKRKGWA